MVVLYLHGSAVSAQNRRALRHYGQKYRWCWEFAHFEAMKRHGGMLALALQHTILTRQEACTLSLRTTEFIRGSIVYSNHCVHLISALSRRGVLSSPRSSHPVNSTPQYVSDEVAGCHRLVANPPITLSASRTHISVVAL